MKPLLLACLLFASAAGADVCKPSGDPIVTIEHDVVAGVKKPTSVTKLLRQRRMDRVRRDRSRGQSGRTATGCSRQGRRHAHQDRARRRAVDDHAPAGALHGGGADVHGVRRGRQELHREDVLGMDILDRDKTHGALRGCRQDAELGVGAEELNRQPATGDHPLPVAGCRLPVACCLLPVEGSLLLLLLPHVAPLQPEVRLRRRELLRLLAAGAPRRGPTPRRRSSPRPRSASRDRARSPRAPCNGSAPVSARACAVSCRRVLKS